MSLLAWANQLPEDWNVKPLRSVSDYVVSNVDKVSRDHEIPVSLCNYKDVYNSEFITLARDFMRGTASEAEIAKFGIAIGDVIITKDSESWDDIGVPALVKETSDDLVCGYHLALLRPFKQAIHGAFLLRCLQAGPIRVQLELAARGVTRFGIPKSEIGTMSLPVPPLAHQQLIADYLDCETARLDALVEEKERVLGLLAERRRALTSRAVTRGLDPGAPLRDSELPWLGEIPSDWETRRIAWLFRERNERGDPDLPLLQVSINTGVSVREFSDDRIETTAADFNIYKIARRGDVVFNKMRMWQGAVGIAPQDGLVSPDYVVAAPTGALLPQYAGLLFRTDRFSAECARRSHGIVWDRLRLYWPGFRDIEVPVPSTNTQRVIADHVAGATAKVDALVRAAKGAIALLGERRGALIAAAVAGRIDMEGGP